MENTFLFQLALECNYPQKAVLDLKGTANITLMSDHAKAIHNVTGRLTIEESALIWLYSKKIRRFVEKSRKFFGNVIPRLGHHVQI